MSDGIWHRNIKGKRHHEYGCPQCGHIWTSRGYYPLWPISFFARWKLLTMRKPAGGLRWSRLLKWSRHWVQIGGNGPDRPIHTTIVQWLFFGVRFGPMHKGYESPVLYIPNHGWYPRTMGEKILKYLAEQRHVAPQTDTTYRRVDAP